MPRGRPKLLPDTHQVHLLVPREDYHAIEAKAVAEGLPLPDYLRTVLHRVAQKPEQRTAMEQARHRRIQRLATAIERLIEAKGPAA